MCAQHNIPPDKAPGSAPGSERFALCLVGCGQMGSALLDGWDASKRIDPDRSLIIDPAPSARAYAARLKVHYHPSLEDLGDTIDQSIIILAVKPQHCDDVLRAIRKKITTRHLLISIASGRRLATLASYLHDKTPIVRVMPNLPVRVGRGASAAFANTVTGKAHKNATDTLFRGCGAFIWTENENLLDAVTAISGSGPAYIFYFIEALSQAGTAIGLDRASATHLARQVAIGAGALLESEPDATALRQKVTSPQGTTAAALNVLAGGDLPKDRAIPKTGPLNRLLKEAVDAAYARAIEFRQ